MEQFVLPLGPFFLLHMHARRREISSDLEIGLKRSRPLVLSVAFGFGFAGPRSSPIYTRCYQR